ncbi:MAG: helix-turn-helix transcriptional regulator [Chloroflexi bacterium]|nr:helix-turn-helix transcriptional regulator [Chloroflexota bacterium]
MLAMAQNLRDVGTATICRESGMPTIPRSTSTRDFERYTLTKPVLSSAGMGWREVVVREFHEPPRVDSVLLPAVSDIHLVLMTSGAMQFECREKDGSWEAVPIHEGDLFLTPGGGDAYELRWRSLARAPIEALHLHLSRDLFARSAEQVADRDPARLTLKELSGFRDPLLTEMGLALRQSVVQRTASGVLYAETAAHMLVVHLLTHYLTTDIRLKEYTSGLSRRQMARVTEYVVAHLAEPLSLERLAQQVGYSAYHFAQLFRATTGATPHQFVLSKRFERAKHLLTQTKLSLSQVTFEVGFQSQSHFTHAFVSHFGVTPRQYRQQS